MPRVYPCSFPMCAAFAGRRNGRCPAHAGDAAAAAPHRERQRLYDRTRRDRQAKQFYDSARWQRARQTKLGAEPFCEECQTIAVHVHHRKPLKHCSQREATAQDNLMSLCLPCHSRLEANTRNEG